MPGLVQLPTPMVPLVLCWVAETTLVASALALVAVSGARLHRLGLSPAARHALWVVVLVKLMTPPLVNWPWSLPWPMLIPELFAPNPIVASQEALTRPEDRHDDPGEAGGDVGTVMAGPVSEGTANPAAVVFASGLGMCAPEVAPTAAAWLPAAARGLGLGIVSAWLVGSIAVVVGQSARVLRFRRRLREAVPAPTWLAEEAGRIGLQLVS